ncbi:type II secretion system F family protein [Oceanobacillus luteolus]|uniref:Type II secretion system F family protein n=1 Tax=Oceanobacillus luteolus TaxID=1274358 RepID=A0ABW4HRE6_9BACI|nr:type II secretion system F family protein [Oceanobacillus luteolus]MCM3739536.1 type II secretion system F family protein [Oceanobacillus luteolus]
MDLEQIIGSILIIFLLGTLVFRRLFQSRRRKQVEKEQSKLESMKRERSIQAIRMRTLGGNTLIDYATYELSFGEKVKYTLMAGAVLFGIAYLFYDNFIVSSIVGLLGVFYPRMKKKSLNEKRKNELLLQFKEAISALSSSLAAGQSIENAFRDALKDLKLLYPNDDIHIIKEFNLINRRIENGETVERAIDDFAKRSDIEDIINFSNVFITCKRTGGDLVRVIKQTSDILSDKIEIQQEIRILVSQKKFESKIMAIAPIGIILMLRVSSPEFVAPLFDLGTPGPVVMTVALIFIVLSLFISQKIMDIKI